MTHKKKLIIIFSVAFLLIVIIPAAATLGMHNYYFGNRTVHSNNYYEYLSANHEGFQKEEVTFPSNEGQLLSGAFYKQSSTESEKGLIIWVHGMAVNHENYLGEIQYMTQEGYTVFSYDNTGVNASEGESLIGLTQAVLDLQKALEYVYDLGIYNNMPNILIGHSWGGHAVSTVSQLELPRPVDGIVSLAGFWKNINVIEDIGRSRVGNAASLLAPYLVMYEKYLFKDYSDLNGVDGLKSSNCDVLLIHSKNDSVVLFDNNYLVYQSIFKEDDRFHFIEYQDAGHKLTIDFASYERIHDIMHDQHHYEEDSDDYQKLDLERLSLIEDFNEEVMTDIVTFCENVIQKY